MKLFAHFHHGWKEFSAGMGPFDEAAIINMLYDSHTFLADYQKKIKIEIVMTPDSSFDGSAIVTWASDTPHQMFGGSLYKGDYWFSVPFNFADDFACKYCGGTGMDHYKSPFFHCWACDGTKKQIRSAMRRGQEQVPTKWHPQYKAKQSEITG